MATDYSFAALDDDRDWRGSSWHGSSGGNGGATQAGAFGAVGGGIGGVEDAAGPWPNSA